MESLANSAGSRRGSEATARERATFGDRAIPYHADKLRGPQDHPRRTQMTLENLPVVRDVPSVTAAQMAEVDRRTIHNFAIGVDLLMENAAHQIARAARSGQVGIRFGRGW